MNWFKKKNVVPIAACVFLLGSMWACTPDQGVLSGGQPQEVQQELGKNKVHAVPSTQKMLKLPGLSVDTPKVRPVTPLKKVRLPELQITAKPNKDSFIAHEWGTYTSVASSDGRELEGLQHEEERLPNFVHRRGRYVKGIESTPSGVTQKLETPVIYFYSKKAIDVKVQVDFPKGIISEWYPHSTKWAPSIQYQAPFPADKMKNGTMTWDVRVDPAITKKPAHVPPENIWAPSRQVAATPLYNTGKYQSQEIEKFIFYRGLGRFKVPFTVKSLGQGKIQISNPSKQHIPAIFALHVTTKSAAIVTLGGLNGQTTKTYAINVKHQSIDDYIKNATTLLAVALEKTGLYKDEAWSMVNTWRHSYFKSPAPGLRILYVAPRAWTDALLPITITPKPTSLERTLVGRVELLTKASEADTLQQLKDAFDKGMTLNVALFGRFAEPKLRRALEQITGKALKAYVEMFVKQLARMPVTPW